MIDCREDNRWTVYIHISPSNKYYVGVTSQKNVNSRWRNGKGYEKNLYFSRAIQKYGWNNFKHEILANHLTKNEAVNMEKLLIKKLQCNDYRFGYNICSGGEGCFGLFGKNNPNYGKHWTNVQKEKMSKYKKEHPSRISENGVKRKSDYMKEKWSNEDYRKSMTGANAPCYGRNGVLHPLYGKTGEKNINSKKVICLDTNEVFASATDASKIKKINHSKLCMCCRGERKSCGKDNYGNLLHWKYYEEYLKENNLTDDEARRSLFFIKQKEV